MFIKKANGFIFPAELSIRFHYSIEHQYTFLAVLRPLQEMIPFANGVSYPVN